MKKLFILMLIPLFCIGGFAQSIDPVLMQEMGQRTDDEKIKVVVIMKSQYDRQQLGRRAANYVTRAERREFVVSELKQFAEASQYDLRSSLAEMERHDMTTAPKVIWMANALYFSATKQAINDLAMRRDVALIGLDEEKHVLFDEESRPASNTREITSNITQVNADQVWDLGFTGQGVVVAVIDSGVNYNHLDLADHLWDGGDEYPHHGYDFYNNDNDPMDDHSHGTHCAGTVCGDGTAGSQTGMAPDATLMCIKVLSSGGNGSAAVTCNAMQWAVEHGCDVFSMSLGWANSTITERTLFRNTCAAVLDAGVVGAIAAGNEGNMQGSYPIPNNVRAPGSCPPPYMDPIQANNIGGLSCTVCVGAVDVNDNAAYFTSRGPVTWSNTEFGDYPYTAGSTTDFGLIRPDVCAPGVNIKSAYYGSNNGYTTMSGTSMATPCTAGCISLLLSKNINATPEEICQVLEETAVSLADGKSNTFGYGRIDVLAAINALYSGPLTLESFTVNDSQGNNDGNLNAGESVTLSLTLKNESDLALNGATMTLTSESEYVTITDGTESLPSFNVGQTRTINNMFAFTLSNDAQAKRNVQFTGEIFAGGESLGTVRINVMVYGHILRFEEVTVLNDNNNNGSLEPGETANLHVTITNAGNDLATSVVGALSTAYPYLNINSNNKSFGSLDVNEQASANYSVTLSNSAPQSYTINFGLDLVDAAQKHTNIGFELWRKSITLTSNPTGAGTLSGGGYYGQGQTCTITAEPNDGYAFVSWSLDGTVVSYLPTYTFVVCDEANYVANFQAFNNSIIIGEGSTTNACLPSYSWFNYTLSQQIYTAEEMNSGACQISSVSFFNASGTTYTRNLTIYMVNTSKTAFESNYDWITVSEANQVFSGNVTRTAGSWNTIYFNTPFSYDGHSNVALIVDDNTGSYNSIYYNRAFATESNQSIYIYSDGTNYDPFSPTNYSGSLPMVKNDVVFGKPTYGNIVSVTANPTNGGTVTGGGNCYYGQPITLTATPNEGYVFNNWTKNGEVVSYLSTYQFNVTESATYVANFETIDGIAIGDATYSNYTLPTYYYNSLTEQIYTAAEMGGESTDISSVSFFNTGSSRTRNLSVYLAHTNKTSFESNTDWIAVTENDLVFSGNVIFSANGWTNIYFERLFEYNGVSNVALIVDDNTNSYNSYTSFRTFDAEGTQAIRINGSGTNYDPSNPSDYTGTLMSVKNQVVFGVPNPIYTVTTTVNPTGSGTVSGGDGLYYLGQSCTLTATPNTGYGFYYWRENGTIKSYDPVYTFPVLGNIELEAYFGEPFTITVSANPTEGGTVSGGGEFGYNQQCTVTAAANEGYLFSKWTRNTSSSAVACLPTYTFSVTADADYVAQFTEIDGIAIGEPTNTSYYLPTYTSYPYSLTQQIYTAEEMNSGACNIGSVTFFNAGYGETRNLTVYMVNTGKTSFSSSNDWITVTEADKVFEGSFTTTYRNWSTLYFNTAFHYDGHSNVALIVDDNTNTWSGNTNCRTFDTETTQAIRINGSGTNYDPSNPSDYTGTLMSVKNQVVFGIANPQYYVTVSVDSSGGGTVSGSGGPYFYGQPITISATPNEGYVFNYWTRYNENNGNDEVVSCLSTYQFNVTETATYVANFEAIDGIAIGDATYTNAYLPTYYYYSLSEQIYTAEEMGGEAVDISYVSFFNTGSSRTRNLSVYMVHTDKASFDNTTDWIAVTENDLVFSGNVIFSANGWTNIYFERLFEYNGVSNVALIVDDNTNSYNSYTSFRTFDAEGTQAIRINGSGTNYDPSNPSDYTGTLMSVKNQVVFGIPTSYYTVTASANPAVGGSVSGGGGTYFYGQNITLTATPNNGYVFNNWTKNGEVVSYLSTYQFNVTESATYVANFETIDGIAIGDATYSNYTLPTYYYNSLTEQIYTAAEMGGESTDISSVSFFNTGSSRTRNLSVYLAHTNKTSFESNTDWIAVTENDLVFSGNVIFSANGWTNIYFERLFEYNGVSNVALIVDDNTNSYNSYTSFRTFDAEGTQAIRINGSGTNYDPSNPSDYTGTLMSVKNQVVFGIPTSYYTVTASANPAVGGSVSGGGGTYFYGQNCTLTAAANTGYCFYNWTMDGSVVSTNETYTFPVTGNMSLVANFGEPIAITATANPSEGGTVSGGGNYAQGHTCTLTATANDKYVFLNWTRNGSIVSWLSTYSFTVNTAANYVANFQRVSDGIVIGDAASTSYYLPSYTYYPYYLSQQIYTADEIGMACDISSVAFFNTTTSTPSRNFTVYVVQTDKSSFTGSYDWITVTEADKVFSGNVTIQPRTWTVFTFDRPFHYDGTSNLAVVVDDNTGSYGTSVPFRTYTTTDYQSMYYYNSSTDLDPLNPTNYGYLTTAKNQVIFGFPSFDYTVTVSSEPSYAGSVTGGGTFAYGQPCVVNAVANEGYCFYNWTENDEVVSTDANYAFTVTDNRNLVAHFGLPVTITVSAEPETGGTVSGDGLYAPGHICNLIATPNDGYTFISWTKDGEVVSYLSSYTFVVEGSADYVANFTQISGCIAIGNAFGVTPYLPSNSYYNYSVSQQIYTASEMGGANEISSIAFFNAGSTKTRNLTVYLKHTNKATFNSDNDWITVANSNKVFSGSVTLTSGNWTYIIFNQPFAYNGTSNLVLTVDDNTGDYSYGLNCRAFVADGTQALQAFSDDVNYNPKSPSSYTGSLMSLKNQVIFGLSGNIFNVFATADPAVGGTVSGGGVYQGGSTCTMTATPSNGYHFFYWKENNTVASMANPYEFTVESDRNLTAHFEQVTNHWTVDGSGYSDNMALTAVVQINEIEQRSDLLEVAAFCGTECRGTQLLSYFDLTDRYLVWMTVYGENGDELTFKVYDHRIGQELVMESPNLVFNTNGYGTPIEPYILNFTSMTTISQQLSSGWNWWSSYVEIDMAGLKASLVAAMPDSDDITVKSKSNGFTKWNGTMWLGALRVLDLSQMYMIQAEAPCTLELEGMVSDVGSHPITIINGWNWIGYPCSQSMSVNDALSGFTPEVNDQIKSRNNGYATYISYGSYQGWQGTLNTLEPGQGYMYNSNSNTQKTLVYQTNRSEMLLANITPENNIFVPKDENYAENMTITAVIELDGMELRGEDYELAAFVGNDCRGSVKLMYVEPFDRYVAFLTVYGEPSEKMHFVLTNGRTACKSSDCINYANDATIGTLDEPAVLHFGSTLGVNDLEQVLVNVYPNPSDGIFNIEGNGIRKVEVVDVLGQIVLSKEIENDFLQINLNDKVSGVYLLRVITDKGIYTDRLVRK